MKLSARCLATVASLLGVLSIYCPVAGAAKPSAEDALRLRPVQKDVEIDEPSADVAAKCTISAQRFSGYVGWVVEDPHGVTLRKFVDTDGNNVVDQWCYYKDGLEVYRDIDSDHNGKADQYRWFHTAGSRWAVDTNEDRVIDAWKSISAEEVTAEVVAALATKDAARFARLTLTAAELEALGLGTAKAEQLAEKIGDLGKEFRDLAVRQKVVTPGSKWIQFSGNQPGIVPAGTDESTKDLRVYENVVAIFRDGDEHGQVQIGALVEVGDVWRVIDLPQPIAPGQEEVALSGFFFQGPAARRPGAASTGPSEEFQKLLGEMEKLESSIARASSVAERASLNAQRADLHERIAAAAPTPEDRSMWLRQLADAVSAESQSGGYPDGPARLGDLYEKLKKDPKDRNLATYVRFRELTADYALKMQAPDADFTKVQAEWLKNLETFIEEYPQSADTAEAMLQLAMSQEFAGEEDEAGKWYGRIVDDFPRSSAAAKARGARTRLDCIGKTIDLKGRSVEGKTIDLSDYRGRIAVIQYWATWCGPCKADMAILKDLVNRYGSGKLAVVGVNLDGSLSDVKSFLATNPLPWQQIFEEGGLDSRPANEMGIVTLPTMILVDQQGRVVNRNVQAAELESELEKLTQ